MKKNILQTMLFMSFLSVTVLTPVVSATGVSQAKVVSAKGVAQFLKAGSADWVALDPSTLLTEGDKVKTAENSQVVLELAGNAKTAEVVVRPNSEFTFKTFRHEEMTQKENTLLDVEIGSILVKAEKLVGESKFEVKTPTSIVGIRGTTFEVQVAKTS